METTMQIPQNGFCELQSKEMSEIDGGYYREVFNSLGNLGVGVLTVSAVTGGLLTPVGAFTLGLGGGLAVLGYGGELACNIMGGI